MMSYVIVSVPESIFSRSPVVAVTAYPSIGLHRKWKPSGPMLMMSDELPTQLMNWFPAAPPTARLSVVVKLWFFT